MNQFLFRAYLGRVNRISEQLEGCLIVDVFLVAELVGREREQLEDFALFLGAHVRAEAHQVRHRVLVVVHKLGAGARLNELLDERQVGDAQLGAVVQIVHAMVVDDGDGERRVAVQVDLVDGERVRCAARVELRHEHAERLVRASEGRFVQACVALRLRR